MEPDDIIVVVPTLNEERHIEACVVSLFGDDRAMRRVTIVVADGGSADRTREIVRRMQERLPTLALIDNPDRLQSAAVNRAVATCALPRHSVLVRCDAHAVYPPRYVLDVAETLRAKGVASVTTPMDADGDGCFQKAAAWIVDTPLGSGGSAHRGGRTSQFVDHGHHAGFDLDWFRRVGGYDPSFAWNEDAEFDHRLRQAGGRIWLEASIRVSYRMRTSLGALIKQYWRYGRGRAMNLMKHRSRPRLRQIIPVVHVVVFVASAIVALVWPWALGYPLAYAAAIIGVSLVGTIRLRSACGLWAGAALAAMHFAWGFGFMRALLNGTLSPKARATTMDVKR